MNRKDIGVPLRCPRGGRAALRAAVALIAAFGLLLVLSCGNDAGQSKAAAGKQAGKKQDPGIHKTYERGPAVLALDVDRSKITIADQLHLTIGLTVDENDECELPGVGEKLEQFGIVDYHTSPPELVGNNRKKVTRSYVLEPFLSGEYKIPPLKASFWKLGGKKTGRHEIESEEIVITVQSLLPGDMARLKVHDIVPPVSLPRSYSPWMAAAAVGGGLAVILLSGFLIYRRRNAPKPVSAATVSPHEIAYEELSQLVSRNLIEKGEIKRFYQEISDILRRFIESRFGLAAPEQTTEEFLSGLKNSTGIIAQYKSLL
ncbi:MAG: BatD family protein, partial [Desulfobacterales bacterium]